MTTPDAPADATGPDRACLHLDFVADVAVGRIEPDENGMPKAYVVEVTVRCAAPPGGCGEPFRFTGAPAGLSFAHPTVSVDEKTLNAPIRPASADPDFGLGIPGFAIQQIIQT